MKKIFITILIFFTAVLARTASSRPGAKIYDMKDSDINAWNIKVLNDGRFGHNAKIGEAGGYWPQPYKNFYLFGAGVWIGVYDKEAGQALVTYGYDPNSGASEMVPAISDYWEQGYGNPDDRIYKSTDDDWNKVPWDRFHIKWGKEGPQVFSLQDMFCCFSDFDPEKHSPGDTRPIGVDIYLWLYAWNYAANKDIVFLRYVIKNKSGRKLDSVYVSVTVDPDIGHYKDDMIGLILDKKFVDPETGDTIRADNVGFAWDSDGKEMPSKFWQMGTPGVIGYDYLQSPYALEDGKDNDKDGIVDKDELNENLLKSLYPPRGDKDGDGIGDWEDPSEIEQFGLTAFKRFPIELDPPTDSARYLEMAGYDWWTGAYVPYDSIDPGPADKRFLQATGPFSLKPEDSTIIVVAIIAAEYWKDGKQDTLPLAKASATAQFIYDMNWLLPAPPPPPNVTLIPRDNEIIITWDNYPELQPDPFYRIASDPASAGYNPYYLQYDFQGYKLLKSRDGKNWELMGMWDKKDGIKFSHTTEPDPTKWIIADDKGLTYYYRDKDVINGFPYWYAVTAFDYNYQDTLKTPFWLEGGKRSLSTIPRKEPANYVQGEIVKKEVVIGDTISLRIKADPLGFISETPDTIIYEFSFGAPLPDTTEPVEHSMASYPFLIKWNKGEYRDTIIDYKFGTKYFKNLLPIEGVAFSLDLKTGIIGIPFKSVEIEKGAYPLDSIMLLRVERGLWAYRGSDYRITWRRIGNKLTIEVEDLDKKQKVNFSPYTPEKRENADGWAFQFGASEPLSSIDPFKDNVSCIYLCGGYIRLKGDGGAPLGELSNYIKDGDVWIIRGTKEKGTSPAYNKYLIKFTPFVIRRDTTYTLNVKVVPNPYLVYNQWETRREDRKIAFTNLPSECTIRIYTLAGDLVKVIEHKATSPDSPVLGDKGGWEWWNLLNMHGQIVASGVYIFHVESDVGEQVGKFVIIH